MRMDIQLFAQEKKERATPRRREKARDEGQIPRSADLVSAANFFAAMTALRYSLSFMTKFLAVRSQDLFTMELPAVPDVAWAADSLKNVLLFSALPVAPVILAAGTAGFAVAVTQSGIAFRLGLVRMDFQRVNPAGGLKRMFSRRALAQLFRALLKVGLVGLVALRTLKPAIPKIGAALIHGLPATLTFTLDAVQKVAVNAGILLIAVGIFDYLYEWYEQERSMMMTLQEVKDEMEDQELKPEIRSAIRQKQRSLARRRMMQEVPQADVVIMNPTHFAVALRYRVDKDSAPVVVAKGTDLIALRIKEIARENEVEIVTDPKLARSLYRTTEIGDAIPEELYKAVAEVLAYVYRVSGKGRARM